MRGAGTFNDVQETMTKIRLFLPLFLIAFSTAHAAQAPALRVVVIEGEDAVNIIQQKTAVRPIVEVRDRNDLPVAGALVTFSIEGGKAATFGGASTLTVATNAAGQAAVTGLTPATAGAFQIQVSAAFQGQLATATIAQTNVMTAAQAAAAGAATGGGSSAGSAGGGSAGGAAGGAGGGLSATTIGVVGAAVAGGALAATQVAGKESDEPVSSGNNFDGTFSGNIVSTVTSRNVPANSCAITRAVTGRARIRLDTNTASSVSGTIEVTGTDTVVSQTCTGPAPASSFTEQAPITGTQAAMRGLRTSTDTRSGPNGEVINSTSTFAFEGSMSGNVITGTLKHEHKSVSSGSGGGPVDEAAQGTFPITLTKS